MTDPFEALREPVTPVDPDPEFAGRLRMRLSREILASPGGNMSQQTVAATAEREPASPPALTPYLVVSDARRALDWYVEVFGAHRRGEPIVNADGTIGHAEVGIGDAVLMLSEASTERARSRGASVEREPASQPYGRRAVIVDPFGHRWILLTPPA
jgi:uncharacterized glyoxalase superfamily protein PhnB